MKWSYSAHGAMRRCQRLLVFYQVMASHAARDPDRREAYVLKQFRHLPAWQGSLVHDVLSSRFLADVRAGRRADAAALTAAARDLARRQYDFSAARRYREPGLTKRPQATTTVPCSSTNTAWRLGPKPSPDFTSISPAASTTSPARPSSSRR